MAKTAEAGTSCGSSQQWAFNDQWLGSFCVTTKNDGKRLASASINGSPNGFPNFPGCTVNARWWTTGGKSANSATWSCNSLVSRGGTIVFDYGSAPKFIGHTKICGTFVFSNGGEYWGPAHAICRNT